MVTWLAHLAPAPLVLLLLALLLLLVAWAHQSGWTNPANWPRCDDPYEPPAHPLLKMAGRTW